MAKRKRRNFTLEFKAEVVLEALMGESSQAELCRRHNISDEQLSKWKRQLLENAATLFEPADKQSDADAERIAHLETIRPSDDEKLIGADASHAWFSVYFPDIDWIDFDLTNNQIPTNRYITVAWGRGYSDVTPLKGVVFGSGTHE